MMAEAVKKHYSTHLGSPSREFNFDIEEFPMKVLKWNADANPEEVSLYGTLGSSSRSLRGLDEGHRMEFLLGLLPEKDDVVVSLAILGAHPHLAQTFLDHGHTLKLADPLWPETEMHSFLVMHPAQGIVPALALPDGTHVEFLMAVPLYDSEFAFKRSHSPEELMLGWSEAGVRFYDPNRSAWPSME